MKLFVAKVVVVFAMIFGFTLSEYSVNEIKQQTATGKDPANAIAGHSSETSAEAPYDDFGMVLPELSQQVPVEERAPNDKPDNGVCFNDGKYSTFSFSF